MAKKRATKKKPSPEVQAFAQELNAWGQTLPPKQQTLLKWLLSRCESRGFKGKGSKGTYVIKRTKISEIKINKAVMDALVGYKPDLPTSGWVRGGPIWPKAYGGIWPKAYGS